jgi:hypothetical protein
MPASNSSVVRSRNDLKPVISMRLSFMNLRWGVALLTRHQLKMTVHVSKSILQCKASSVDHAETIAGNGASDYAGSHVELAGQ